MGRFGQLQGSIAVIALVCVVALAVEDVGMAENELREEEGTLQGHEKEALLREHLQRAVRLAISMEKNGERKMMAKMAEMSARMEQMTAKMAYMSQDENMERLKRQELTSKMSEMDKTKKSDGPWHPDLHLLFSPQGPLGNAKRADGGETLGAESTLGESESKISSQLMKVIGTIVAEEVSSKCGSSKKMIKSKGSEGDISLEAKKIMAKCPNGRWCAPHNFKGAVNPLGFCKEVARQRKGDTQHGGDGTRGNVPDFDLCAKRNSIKAPRLSSKARLDGICLPSMNRTRTDLPFILKSKLNSLICSGGCHNGNQCIPGCTDGTLSDVFDWYGTRYVIRNALNTIMSTFANIVSYGCATAPPRSCPWPLVGWDPKKEIEEVQQNMPLGVKCPNFENAIPDLTVHYGGSWWLKKKPNSASEALTELGDADAFGSVKRKVKKTKRKASKSMKKVQKKASSKVTSSMSSIAKSKILPLLNTLPIHGKQLKPLVARAVDMVFEGKASKVPGFLAKDWLQGRKGYLQMWLAEFLPVFITKKMGSVNEKGKNTVARQRRNLDPLFRSADSYQRMCDMLKSMSPIHDDRVFGPNWVDQVTWFGLPKERIVEEGRWPDQSARQKAQGRYITLYAVRARKKRQVIMNSPSSWVYGTGNGNWTQEAGSKAVKYLSCLEKQLKIRETGSNDKSDFTAVLRKECKGLTPESQPKDKAQWTGCTSRIKTRISVCTTCCCKQGLTSVDMKHQLIFGDQTSCATWFAAVDAAIRIGISVYRTALVVSMYKQGCWSGHKAIVAR